MEPRQTIVIRFFYPNQIPKRKKDWTEDTSTDVRPTLPHTKGFQCVFARNSQQKSRPAEKKKNVIVVISLAENCNTIQYLNSKCDSAVQKITHWELHWRLQIVFETAWREDHKNKNIQMTATNHLARMIQQIKDKLEEVVDVVHGEDKIQTLLVNNYWINILNSLRHHSKYLPWGHH